MKKDIFNTKRITIFFNGVKIGADIEPNVTLSEALREIAKNQEKFEERHSEEININDID